MLTPRNKRCLALTFCRSSHPEVFLRKGVLKIGRKFTREHPCRSVISIWNRTSAWVSPVNLLHIFRTHFLKNTCGWLLLFLRILKQEYKYKYVMRCAIWYHVYNLKNVKNTYGVVLILVKLRNAPHIRFFWSKSRGYEYCDKSCKKKECEYWDKWSETQI